MLKEAIERLRAAIVWKPLTWREWIHQRAAACPTLSPLTPQEAFAVDKIAGFATLTDLRIRERDGEYTVYFKESPLQFSRFKPYRSLPLWWPVVYPVAREALSKLIGSNKQVEFLTSERPTFLYQATRPSPRTLELSIKGFIMLRNHPGIRNPEEPKYHHLGYTKPSR